MKTISKTLINELAEKMVTETYNSRKEQLQNKLLGCSDHVIRQNILQQLHNLEKIDLKTITHSTKERLQKTFDQIAGAVITEIIESEFRN